MADMMKTEGRDKAKPTPRPRCLGPDGARGHVARVKDAGWCAFCCKYK